LSTVWRGFPVHNLALSSSTALRASLVWGLGHWRWRGRLRGARRVPSLARPPFARWWLSALAGRPRGR